MTEDGPARLVYMANQIARFFESQPGDAAALQTADHLRSYWDPRMREALHRHVRDGAVGLSPVVVAAAGLLANTSDKRRSAALVAQGGSIATAVGDDAG